MYDWTKTSFLFIFQILNQDAAKTFLFKCDEYKLYEFFMRATQVCSLKPILFQSFPSRPTNSKIWLTVWWLKMFLRLVASQGDFFTKSNKKNINNSQALFLTFRKKLKAKKLKQILEKLKKIIQKLNNLPTKTEFWFKKVPKLIYFAQKFAQTLVFLQNEA